MLKRLFNLKWIFLAELFLQTSHAELVAIPAPPAIAAKAWMMQDFHTGKILAAENIDLALEPASLTKVMTAYIVLEKLKEGFISLDDEVEISEKAWRMGGSRMFIKVNTKVRLEDLLRGLIIQSGNDAAVALAEHVAESEENFVSLMNNKAAQLGMLNTNFKNTTGWPDKEHVTTAADLMLLATALIRDMSEYYGFYSEKSFTYNNIPQRNRNVLLWEPSVDGIKTGFTDNSGYSLMASAKRGDMRLITVMLGAKSESARASYTRNLFDFAYRFYETKKLYIKDQILQTVNVWQGETDKVDLVPVEDVFVTIPRGLYEDLSAEMNIALDINAPVQTGIQYGEGVIQLQDQEIKKFAITAKNNVAEGNLWQRLRDSVLSLL